VTLREERKVSVFENRVLRGVFGSGVQWSGVEWRKLHKEELHGLYCSPNIVRVIKSRRMRWVWHVARVGWREVCTGCCWGNLRERDHWGDPGVDGRIILGWIFRKWDVMVWIGLGWLRIERSGKQF
jgi:hypothetical protein